MNPDRPSPAYVSAPHLRWVNDGQTTLLVDTATGRSHRLQGIEAAAWRSFAASCSTSQVVALLALCEGISPDAARGLLHDMLAGWAALGLLETGDDARG